MQNRMNRLSAIFGATAMAAASLTGAPAAAQTGSGTGDPAEPAYCYSTEGKYWYPCCHRWDPCTQIWVDSPLPPQEPPKSPDE
jgi:hypothetical protein